MIAPVIAQDETPLGLQMESINDAFKAFRKETDPAKGAAQAREAQAALIKAFPEIPQLIKDMPQGADREKALAQYHKMTGQLYVTLCEVEIAFLDGKTDEVAKLVDSIKLMKKEGHKEFMKDDE